MSQTTRELLAHNVAKYRNQKKLSREELSLTLNFDNSYISKLERCKVNITIDRMSKIAQYFEVEVKDLLS